MTDHVAIARGGTVSDPLIIATERVQRHRLVDVALRDPGYTGIHARTHHHATLYIAEPPVQLDEPPTDRRWMEIGSFAGFGGVLFVSDPRPLGDFHSDTDQDWAWIALPAGQIESVPAVYFDQPSETQFPPRAVMTIEQLHEVALEWVNTGERPTSVGWLAVNSLRWKLDGLGDIARSPDMM